MASRFQCGRDTVVAGPGARVPACIAVAPSVVAVRKIPQRVVRYPFSVAPASERSTRSTFAASWPVYPGRMSALITRETRGPKA